MQDRYLFRGKRLDNGEWVRGSYAEDCFWGQSCIFCKPYRYPFEVDPSTVGQCTGLLAAKSYRGESEEDRLIFEGDILKDLDTGNVRHMLYNAPSFVLVDENRFFYWSYHADEYEIIGNIHDRTEENK